MGYVRWHWHEEMEINLVKSGSAEFTIGEEKVIVNEGQALILNCNVFHSIKAIDNNNCVLLSLLFNPNILFKDHTTSLATGYLTPVIDSKEHRYLLFDRKDMWGRSALAYLSDIFDANFSQGFGYELTTKAYLCQLWVHLLKKYKSGPVISSWQKKESVSLSPDEVRIKDAIIYIQQHYVESITLDDICNEVYRSKYHLCRNFKRAVGMTIMEYLLKTRIAAAQNLLRSSYASIGEISEQCGFSGISYFSQIFKKTVGITPIQYRKQNQKSENA